MYPTMTTKKQAQTTPKMIIATVTTKRQIQSLLTKMLNFFFYYDLQVTTSKNKTTWTA